MNIVFPDDVKKYVELQCNGDLSLYTSFPELKYSDAIFKSLSPKNIIEIGAGIGRASVFLMKKYGWYDSSFHFIDGDSGDKQFDGVRSLNNEYYNSFSSASSFCKGNGMNTLSQWIASSNEWKESLKDVDLVYSFLAIGFHWPITLYLKSLLPVVSNKCTLVFGIRGEEKKDWVLSQVNDIPSEYRLKVLELKPTSERSSILVLERV